MKISSPYPPEINSALSENITGLEFATEGEKLPDLPLPLRLGELLNYIESASYKNLTIGNFRIDTTKNTITGNNQTIDLTEKETAILKYLTTGPATRETMLKNIWGYSDNADSKTVENHIYRLRNKIQETFGKEIIITESGNYKLA